MNITHGLIISKQTLLAIDVQSQESNVSIELDDLEESLEDEQVLWFMKNNLLIL